MDHPILLHSRGAIVSPPPAATPYGKEYNVPLLNIAPYIETVPIPVISVDSSAIYGDHPENLATVTISSGAALTFFVDSMAGGDDMSGDGSLDNPWRSLRAAEKFLRCAECLLAASVDYVQVKIKGTVDYYPGYSTASRWNPFPSHSGKIIIAGWNEKANLIFSSATYDAGYYYNVVGSNMGGICSGCGISGINSSARGAALAAIDCEINHAIVTSVIYNCSGADLARRVRPLVPVTVYGGSFSGGVHADFIYSANAEISGRGYIDVVQAAVSLHVSAITSAHGVNTYVSADAVGLRAEGSAYLGNCIVSNTAIASGGHTCVAYADVNVGATIISGGTYYARAIARTDGSSSIISARAEVHGLPSTAIVNGAIVDVSATATAGVAYNYRAYEVETTENLGTSCAISRIFYYSSATLFSSSITSSGVCP